MGRPKKQVDESNRQRNLLAIRGTDEWKTWLDGLAKKKRVPITVLIDLALADFAKAIGYPEPPSRY